MNLHALVRRPSPALARGERTFVPPGPLDLERARAEHAAYVAELERAGVRVEHLPELPEHPDGVFVEDAAVVLEDVAVVGDPGAPSRRGEVASVARALARHREVVRLAAGTLDGGDVLRVDDTLLVGRSSRTDHAALRALAHLVLEHGLRVKAVEVRGCLHLKTAATWLGRGALLANPAWIGLERAPRVDLVEVDPREPFAANALVLGEVVLMPSAFPRTAERVASRGFEVRPLELSELAKAEAGPTCLSLVFDVAE